MSTKNKSKGSIDIVSQSDIGVQVNITNSPQANIKCNPLVDLGYDSLNSTPKQKSNQIDTIKSEYEQEDTDDNASNDSGESWHWTKKLSNLEALSVLCFWRSREVAQREKRDKEDNGKALEEPEERIEWNKKMDFLLSIIGFAVDLANVWRFPYLCYKNGGGVFLIPYTLMLIFGALPLFFMELALGQFAKAGPISLWDKICPAFKGVGYCCVLISWYVSFYYNVIIGWTFYFIMSTLTAESELPWQSCDNEWNTPNCFAVSKMMNNSCTHNCTKTNHELTINRSSSAQEFFERKVLQINLSSGLSDMGKLRPELVVCVICVFIMLYFSLFKGVKSSGKVVWITATAPYAILTILLIRGLFLPGAGSGVLYYLSPRFEKLLEVSVWTDAAMQVFFSIGVGFGVHLTYASFNKFNNNCYRDALLTACVNSCTSFYSGFVIFTYLGYMAHSLSKDIENVASEGYGLVFQVYPEALSTLPFAKFWSLLFFLMLVTLGLDSAMGGLEAVITGLMDEFKFKRLKREHFTAIVIFTSFIGTLINCTQGGGYTMYWFDNYSAGVSLLCSALFEAIAITYCYGLDKFASDVETMVGFRPLRYWQICWKYVSPLFLICIVVASVISSENLEFHHYSYPLWATVLGWGLSLSSVSAIPIVALIYWSKRRTGVATQSGTVSVGIENPSATSPIYV